MPIHSPIVTEFRYYCEQFGPSHTVAAILHRSPDAVRSWCCGKRAVDPLALDYLKLLAKSRNLAPLEAVGPETEQFRMAKDKRTAFQKAQTKAIKRRLDAGKGQLSITEAQRKYLADQTLEASIIAGNPTLQTPC